MAKYDDLNGASSGGDGRSSSATGGVAASGHRGGAAETAMFKSLAGRSQEFIGICDLELKPFYVNEAGRRLVGLGSLEEACAARVQDYFFPEDQRFLTEEFLPKVLKEGAAEVEIRFRHFQTGAALWMIYNMFRVQDGEGRVIGYGTVSRDVTERRRAEAELRRGKELSEAVTRISDMLHSSLDTEEVIRRMVQDGAAALGSETAAISERNEAGWEVRYAHGMPAGVVGMVLSDDTERHAVLAVSSGEVVAVEDGFNDERFNREHFRRYHIRSVLVAPVFRRGAPFGAIFFNYHSGRQVFTEEELNFAKQLAASAASALENAFLFAERKRAEEEAAAAFARVQTIMETAQVAILVAHDAQCRQVTGNALAHAFLGVPMEGNLSATPGEGQPRMGWRALCDGRELSGKELPMQRAARTGEIVRNEELEVVRCNGERAVILATAAPLRDRSGAVTGAVGTLLDITERKRAEEALRHSQERQAYLLRLGDTLRPLTGPAEIQEAAARVLGEHLGTERVAYFEVLGKDYVVKRDYAQGVPHLRGRFPIAAFGARLWETYEAGKRIVVADVQTEPSLSPEERQAYARIQIGAHVGVPLVKGGRLVAGLAAHAQKRREWTAEDLQLIEETAERTWAEVARARAEAELRESEKDYRTLFNSIDEGFCVLEILFDAEGKPNDWRFVEVNPAFERHNGLGQATGKRIRELAPGIEAKWVEIYGKVAQTGQAIRCVESSEALNRWFDLYAFPVGKPEEHRVAVLFSDITGRKQADTALERAHERLQYHIQNTPLAVIEFDAQLRVSLWSGQAERIFGWKASEVLGRPMFDIPWLLEEDRAAIEKVAEGMNTGRTPSNVSPNRNVRKDGKVIWCEWYNSSLNAASGEMQSIQSLVLDVTERKQAEAVLARSKEELEHLVAERTAKLHEMVGELEHLSYTITHDMRAPLRAIRGFAEAIKELCAENPHPELDIFLNRMMQGAERMDLLITDALQYTKAVRQEIPLSPVDAGELLRGMLETYPEFIEADIALSEPLLPVMGNEAALTQCFSNLIGNAVKFVKKGQKAKVQIWSERIQGPGEGAEGWVRIWVEDQGIGMPEAMRPKLFQMFARGTREYPGTGVGLALVRKVVQRMGGRVGVESEEGKGSRFWVELRPGGLQDRLTAELKNVIRGEA